MLPLFFSFPVLLLNFAWSQLTAMVEGRAGGKMFNSLLYISSVLHFLQFPHANVSLILSKLKGPASAHHSNIKIAFIQADTTNQKTLTFHQFRWLYYRIDCSTKSNPVPCICFHRKVVQGLSQSLLNEHEILTLARCYGKRHYPILTTLIHIVQDTLKKLNYTQFSELQAALEAVDVGQGGFVRREQVRHTCHAVGFPLSDQLTDGVMMKWVRVQYGNVESARHCGWLSWCVHAQSFILCSKTENTQV